MAPRIDSMATGVTQLGTPVVTKGVDAQRPSGWEKAPPINMTGPAAAESNKGIDSGMSQVRTPDPTPNRPPRTPRGADIAGMMRDGGSKEAGPGRAPILDSENTKAIGDGGQEFSAGLAADAEPITKATPKRPGDATNVSKGAGITAGKPAAGEGPGTGRQPQTVIGQTKARPRSQGGGFIGAK